MASLNGFRAITLPVEMLRVGLTPTRPDAAWTSSKQLSSLVREADIILTARLHIPGPLHDTMVLFFSRHSSCEDSMKFAQSAEAPVAMSGGGDDSAAMFFSPCPYCFLPAHNPERRVSISIRQCV